MTDEIDREATIEEKEAKLKELEGAIKRHNRSAADKALNEYAELIRQGKKEKEV